MSSDNADDSSNTNSKRILLVDDEPDVISTFKMILEMNGFEVDPYRDPLAHYLVSIQIHMVYWY
jgi:DNA-binding response OmpR family regulator